jgi:hypothetical protein
MILNYHLFIFIIIDNIDRILQNIQSNIRKYLWNIAYLKKIDKLISKPLKEKNLIFVSNKKIYKEFSPNLYSLPKKIH